MTILACSLGGGWVGWTPPAGGLLTLTHHGHHGGHHVGEHLCVGVGVGLRGPRGGPLALETRLGFWATPVGRGPAVPSPGLVGWGGPLVGKIPTSARSSRLALGLTLTLA